MMTVSDIIPGKWAKYLVEHIYAEPMYQDVSKVDVGLKCLFGEKWRWKNANANNNGHICVCHGCSGGPPPKTLFPQILGLNRALGMKSLTLYSHADGDSQ